jgi:hypothetical protein
MFPEAASTFGRVFGFMFSPILRFATSPCSSAAVQFSSPVG